MAPLAGSHDAVPPLLPLLLPLLLLLLLLLQCRTMPKGGAQRRRRRRRRQRVGASVARGALVEGDDEGSLAPGERTVTPDAPGARRAEHVRSALPQKHHPGFSRPTLPPSHISARTNQIEPIRRFEH